MTKDTQHGLDSHRFRVSDNGSEKLSLLRNNFKEFVSQHPELVGLTVFGSHTKGLEKPDSDIDMFFFIDEDEADYLPNQPTSVVVSSTQDSNFLEAQQRVGLPFKELIAKNFAFTDGQLKDVRMRLLSKSRIDAELKAFENYERKLRESEIGNGDRPGIEELPEAADLGRIFNMQLGKGLDAYRAYVLKKLENLGELGDRIWEKFMYTFTLEEESGKIPTSGFLDGGTFREKRKILYPHTVADAVKYFCLVNVLPKY